MPKYPVDTRLLLEATDTTHEDFQAVYSSMFELIMEPLQKEKNQEPVSHSTKDSQECSDLRPAKRRKLDDTEYGSNVNGNIWAHDVEEKKAERSVLNEVLDRSKISSSKVEPSICLQNLTQFS